MSALYGYAPGDYMGTCVDCDQPFVGEKRAVQCFSCAVSQNDALLANREAELNDYKATLEEIKHQAANWPGLEYSFFSYLMRSVDEALAKHSGGVGNG